MPNVTRTVTKTTPKKRVDTEKLLLGYYKAAHDSFATGISPTTSLVPGELAQVVKVRNIVI